MTAQLTEETIAAITEKTRLQAKARAAVRRAIRRGDLVRGECAHAAQPELRGGCSGRVEAHHEDHSQPLKVVWLCLMHHHRLHGARAWGNYSHEETQA